MKAWGLRGRLIVGALLVTAGAIILMGFLSIKMLEWSLLYAKAKEAEIIATTVQAVLKDGKGYETNAFKGLAAKLVEKGAIQALSIVGSGNAPVFVVGKGTALRADGGKDLYLIGGLDIKMTGAGWFEGVGREFLVSAPLTGSTGTIIFSMPLADIRAEILNFKKFVYFYIIFNSVVIIAFGVYLLPGVIQEVKAAQE
ncbi:MAG: hypothetical protein HY886_09125 [Deltaproteobacteria bacterium]|nr:hypothetical protein [Deltaproteobacteria bacterium]